MQVLRIFCRHQVPHPKPLGLPLCLAGNRVFVQQEQCQFGIMPVTQNACIQSWMQPGSLAMQRHYRDKFLAAAISHSLAFSLNDLYSDHLPCNFASLNWSSCPKCCFIPVAGKSCQVLLHFVLIHMSFPTTQSPVWSCHKGLIWISP